MADTAAGVGAGVPAPPSGAGGDSAEGEEVIVSPRTEVAQHVLVKSVQAGATVATVVAVAWQAVVAVRGRGSGVGAAVTAVGKTAVVGAGLGAALSYPMTYFKLKDAEPITIYDRAYRLRYNASQNRVDIFTAYAAGAGAVAGTLYWRNVAGPIRGAVLAIPLGIIAHLVTSSKKTA